MVIESNAGEDQAQRLGTHDEFVMRVRSCLVNSVLAANGVIRRGEESKWELITTFLLTWFPRNERRGRKSLEKKKLMESIYKYELCRRHSHYHRQDTCSQHHQYDATCTLDSGIIFRRMYCLTWLCVMWRTISNIVPQKPVPCAIVKYFE